MKVYIVQATEYWQNYRGEWGSMHNIEKVFASESMAVQYLKSMRAKIANSQVRDVSDEPNRVVAFKYRSDNRPYIDLWINEMEVE